MVHYFSFSSKKIKDFPLSGEADRCFPIYFPPNYSENGPKCGVTFVLAGWGSRSSKYAHHDSAFGNSLVGECDRAIRSGKMPPTLLVFPDGTTPYGCSQYINSDSSGYFMDYICDELVPWIDENFNTTSRPEDRAAIGHSSGGFGALWLGMLRPDRFQRICSSAGDSYFEASILPWIQPSIAEVESAGSVESFIENFLKNPNPTALGKSKLFTMLTLSLAGCYAARAKKPPLYGELFFDLSNGQIKQEIWEEYLRWDPAKQIVGHKKNLELLKYLSLEAGLKDEFSAQLGHRQIAEQLKTLGIQHEFHEYPGAHGGQSWRLPEQIQRMWNQSS